MMTRRSNRERAPSRKVMESQTPTRVQQSINASDKPVLKDFGKKDDAVAKVPAQSSQPKVHCQKLTAKSPAQSLQFKAHSPKPGPKPSSVAQVQQKSQVQQETNDQSVHFSGVNTTNECNEFPTTHYALTL